MYGVPELHLFNAESMADWWKMSDNSTFPRADGTLRTIAQLSFGAQTEETVRASLTGVAPAAFIPDHGRSAGVDFTQGLFAHSRGEKFEYRASR